jgi:proteasome lid subunit RPN8/RPN11
MKKKKVTIEIEQEAHEQVHEALKDFGNYEIGGMLIGYKKGENIFSISKATVADDVANFNIASFIREPFKSMKVLLKAFKREKHNYIGEWHSHPQFSLYPSESDIETMHGILNNSEYGVNFVILIITKLKNEKVDMAAFLFHKKLTHFIEASISSHISINKHLDIMT